MAWGAAKLNKSVWLFAEVPCIDRVFETGRLADFFYEHPSQFTTKSFCELMMCAGEISEWSHGYNGEVVYALVRLGVTNTMQSYAAAAARFAMQSDHSRNTIRAQLAELADSGKTVAVWGGTGKAAAFIHQYGIDVDRFPLVVDSDIDKVGTFVPGSGQEIVYRDQLKNASVDIVIIPTQWRAKDIVAEIKREAIVADRILIEHDGELVDFFAGDHPYR